MKEMEIEIRKMKPEDEAFIYSTWLRGLYYGNSYYRKIDKDHYMAHQSQIIAHSLEMEDVRVAVLKDDPDVILGYAVIGTLPPRNGKILRWVFVKQTFRRFGIAKKLIDGENIIAVSSLTKTGDALRKDLLYLPFID